MCSPSANAKARAARGVGLMAGGSGRKVAPGSNANTLARNCNLHVYKPLLHVMRLLFILSVAVPRRVEPLLTGLAPVTSEPLGFVIIKPKFSRCDDN